MRYTHSRRPAPYRPASRARPPQTDTLPRRLVLALLLVAAVAALRYYDPALLEPLRARLTANTGAVAEAFARFTDTVGEGEPVVEAWAALTEDLSHLSEAAETEAP